MLNAEHLPNDGKEASWSRVKRAASRGRMGYGLTDSTLDTGVV